MIGREPEAARLARMVAGARAGQGSAIVLRGEAGIGKSALLAHVADTAAADLLVLRAVGVESESELPFAALHLLLRPAAHLVDRLPATQRQALRRAFREEHGDAPDRFLIGLAVLTLLADLAEERPLLCLVDDAQWLDRASLDALLFASRRLEAERIALVLAVRDAAGLPVDGVPELPLSALGRADSERLLAEHVAGLGPQARDRVIAEAEGNPFALLHFAAHLSDEQRSGHLAPLPLGTSEASSGGRLERSVSAAVQRLPDRTRLLLLVAAADGSGELALVLRAAQALGAGPPDLAAAERTALVEVADGHLRFHHPLIKAAAYHEAPMLRRAAAHRALAELLSGDEHADRRAWHLAAAALEPDEEVSGILAETGRRAQARGAHGAAATAYERAAQLTADRGRRARWLAAAAEAMLAAGQLDRAAAGAARGRRLTADSVLLARLDRVRGAVEAEQGDPVSAMHLLISAASGVAGVAPSDAATLLASAAGQAWFAGEHGELRKAADLLTSLGSAVEPHQLPVTAAVRGMERLAAGDPAAGLSHLRRAAPPAGTAAADQLAGTYAVFGALMTGDDDAAGELAAARVDACRAQGLVGALPHALAMLTQAQILRGGYAEAAESGAEAWRIADDTGQTGRLRHLRGVLARLAAIRGDDEECLRLAGRPQGAAEERHGSGWGDSSLSLLDLARARYARAAERLTPLLRGPLGHTVVVTFAVADFVEACARLGEPDRAVAAFTRFDAWTEASGRPWARAVAHRCRALLAPSDGADAHYDAALRLHARDGRPFERARTELVYGEWLRRERRRADAAVQLRAARRTFASLGAAPWAERAGRELVAAGGRVARAEPDGPGSALDALTPQELQVVRLAATGATNRQIGAQLFLSPRTVGSHLYRAYPKLGVSSRAELAGLVVPARPCTG
ncbi:ATP-binding protein [Myceligenerans xiligouense]|uniref:Regulatory LuxR family protein n=1 Tax=Myceligenerans xiligouense TaxID=253184 RepID=A0A3N4ZKC6_9MICO|nr:helix-turn-helix transcriptional regulator [Myceligenerans xiligouense]RPF20391.1 regulatory LuxR family protein [Myceligenerans xiligouense]